MRSYQKAVTVGGPRKGNSFSFGRRGSAVPSVIIGEATHKCSAFFANKFTDHRGTLSSV